MKKTSFHILGRSNVLIGLLILLFLLASPTFSSTITTEYASGAGSTDTFTVTPDTVWLGTYSDSDTDSVFWHRGQQILSISTVTITTSQAVGLRSWKNEDRVIVYDDATTPNVVQTTINGTPSGSTITLTDSAAAVTGTNKWISKNLIVDPNMEHSNANAYTAGDAQTTLAKDQTIVKFDTDSLKITNGDATQAFARQTITTAAGEDYLFHGWFYSPTTPNGASQLVDVDLTAALGITATQANLSAGWNEIDFTFEAADTATTIDLGSGSITNAEIGYWDNVKIHKNLVNNGGMETGGTVDVSLPSNWKVNGTPTSQFKANTASNGGTGKVHSGTFSIYTNADASFEGVASDAFAVVQNKYYTGSAWIYIVSGPVVFGASNQLNSISKTLNTTGSWQKVSWTTYSPIGGIPVVFVRASSGAAEFYIDDISLIELDQDDPTTTGATTPSTSANSFGTGKWSDSSGSFRADGLDTLTYPNTNIVADRGTIAFWANIKSPYNAAENKVFLDARGADDNNRVKIFYQASDDKFTLYLNGANRIQSAAQVNNSNFYSWHHFVFAYDFVSDRYTFYIDGVSIGTDTAALTAFSLGVNNIYVGSNYDSSGQADAFFDDVFFFKKELTLNEIRRLYALPRSANFRSLLGGW